MCVAHHRIIEIEIKVKDGKKFKKLDLKLPTVNHQERVIVLKEVILYKELSDQLMDR